MSLEAWGDEGNVPFRWEDTAMRQEWDIVRSKLRDWKARFKHEFPNDEVPQFLNEINDLMDRLEDEQMSGSL